VRRSGFLKPTIVARPVLREPEHVEGFVKNRTSIVMPAYNEADCITGSVADVAKQFELVCPDFEIIVVDDGSNDGTRKIAEELTYDKMRVVGYEENQGKGHALKLGLYNATGEFAFLVDSDLEIRAKDLVSYFDALESADFVIGSKRHHLSNVRTPAMRKFLSLGFNILERLLTGVRVSDTQAGLKAMRSSALYKVLPLLSVKRYAFDAELLAVASLYGFKITELPISIDLKATFSARQVFRMLIDLMGIGYRLRIRRWYQKNMEEVSNTYTPIIPW
jgi:glycosyltransferase involved in cell wall biosynthesis